MSKKENQDMVVEFTPLEKIEALYSELTDWYGEADNKELRVAAKLLMVSLEKFSIYGGSDWHFTLIAEFEVQQAPLSKNRRFSCSLLSSLANFRVCLGR